MDGLPLLVFILGKLCVIFTVSGYHIHVLYNLSFSSEVYMCCYTMTLQLGINNSIIIFLLTNLQKTFKFSTHYTQVLS